MQTTTIILFCLALTGTSSCTSDKRASTRWPGFRGYGDSRTEATNLPLVWSEKDNIDWTAELPGYGESSPVIWDGRVFVTASEGKMKETLVVLAFELATGDSLWTRRFEASQKIERTEFVSQSAPTPAVDADGLYTFFESGDVIALDHDGNKLWSRSLTREYGDFAGNHGIGGSVAQTDDALVILLDHDGPSYLLSMDKKTGANKWKVDRQQRASWTTPVVSDSNGRVEIIISSGGIVEAVAAESGRQLWYVDGVRKNTVPSPTVTDDLVVVGSSAKGWNLAIARGGSGNVSESRIRWKSEASPSGFGSPLVYGGCVYIVNKIGVLTCVALKTGAVNWTYRLGEGVWASPIAARDCLYFFGKDGKTTIMKADKTEPVTLRVNTLPTPNTVYGVAAVDGVFIIRTGGRLTCVGQSIKNAVF